MPVNLSQAARTPVNLDQDIDPFARQVDTANMSQVGRGWTAAGLGSRANDTYAQARKAYLAGDLEGGRVLEQQAQDIDQQTAEVAPRVSSLRDINGFGDVMDWAAGAVGNMRTSIAPALGGLAGAAIGTVAAPLTGGVVNPATAGFAGSALAGGQEEYNEAIGSAMRDPTIRATKSMEEIGDTSLGKAAVNSMLEAAVPTIMGGKLLGKGAKSVVGSGTAGAVKHVAKNVGGGAAGEFVTEGAQSLSGQAAQNALLEKPLTDFDYMQALDEAAAGAVGGGGMGIVGGGADVAYNRLGKGVDKVNEVRKDPVGKTVDAIADAGTALGKGKARFEEWVERATSVPTRSRDALIYPERHNMSQDDLKGSATAWAEHVLNNQRDFSERERNDAAEFIKGGNTELYRTKVEIAHRENQIANDDMRIVDEIAERLGKKSKSSRMNTRSSTEEMETPTPTYFNYDSMQRAAAIQSAQNADTRIQGPTQTPVWDYEDRTRRKERGAAAYAKFPQQLETTADIWRKQGVSQKLLKATSEHTDSKQREMAIAMMGWIQNGFNDVDGEMFVPERFTAAYGKNAPKLIRSAAEQALFDGMIDDKTFAKLAEVETMAQMQHAENTAAYDAVVGNMTEAARNAYSPDSIKEFIPEMRRMAQEGTTKAEENFLLRLYGSKEKIAAAMSKFKDKGNESKIVGPMAESTAQRDEDGNVVNDENALVEDGYENDVEIAPGEERTTYEGLGDDHVPYNTLYDDKKKELATRLSALANEPKKFSRAVGAWTALKEQFGHNPALLREKEDQALSKSLSKGVLPKMNDDRRTSLLKAYDKNFKVIKVTESLSETLPDTVTPQQVESFREKSHNAQIKGEWVTGGGNTPENGRLYLERKETINKETGEATGKNEAFLTSAARLIKHVWDSEGMQAEGRTNANAGKGALGEYQAFLRGLSALIQSDGSFTGRVGVVGSDGKMKILGEKGALPGSLRLMKGTVAAAKRQQKQETLSGDAMGAPLSDKDISAEAGNEITSYTDRNIVPSESTSSEARADTLLAEGSTGEIYRDEKTGIQTGLGLDAEAFAVGGNSRGGRPTTVLDEKGNVKLAAEDRPAVEPRLKKKRQLGDQLAARDWVADLLRKGVPAFNAAAMKYANDQEVKDRIRNGLKTLLKFSPSGLIDVYDSKLTMEQAGTIISRARKVLGDYDVRDDVAGVEANVRGQGNALGGQRSKEERAERYQRGTIAEADMGSGTRVPQQISERSQRDTDGAVDQTANGIRGSTIQQTVSGAETSGGREATSGVETSDIRSAPGASVGQGLGELNDVASAVATLEALDQTFVKDVVRENYSKLLGDTVESAIDFARRLGDAARAWRTLDVHIDPEGTYDDAWHKHMEFGTQADSLAYEASNFIKDPENYTGTDFDSFFDGVEYTDEDVMAFVEALVGDTASGNVKQSRLSADIHKVLGKEGIAATHDSPIRHEGKFNWREHKGKGEGAAAFGAGTYLSTADGVHKSYKGQFTAKMTEGNEQTFSMNGVEYARVYDEETGEYYTEKRDADEYSSMSSAEEALVEAVFGDKNITNAEQAKKAALEEANRWGGQYSAEHYDILDIVQDRIANVVERDVMHAAFARAKNAVRKFQTIDAELVRALGKYTLDLNRWNNTVNWHNKRFEAIKSFDIKDFKVDRNPFKEASPTYHVTVKVTPEELLDWDAPLSEQSALVQKALADVVKTLAKKAEQREFTNLQRKLASRIIEGKSTGSDIYSRIAGELGSQTEASDYLQSLGIVGHKYAASGGRDDDHPNYVIYDDRRIETNYVSFNSQNADIQGRQAKQEEVDAAVKHLADILGDSVKVDFKKWFGDNSSGRWTERRKRNLIELALNGDVLGTAYHESMHEFFNQLGRHGAENVQALMKRVATNKIIMRQLHKLLKDHEKAVAQLNDPEEALAYMYQFWQAGLLKIGPETQTFFEKVANFLRTVFKRVQPEIKDMKQAELLLRAFSGGAIKEGATKAAVIEAMRKDVEAHDRAIEALGKGTNALVDAFGKLTFSAEAIMERTGNKHMVEIMRMANQKAGEAMRDKQAYFDAVHAAKGRWMNKLQNMLTGHDQDVLNIARESLNTGKPTHHPEAKALAANVRKYLDEMFDYVTERGVMRWDAEADNKKWGTKGDWVPVQKRKDYFMQVWSTETLLKNKDEFIKLMLEHHVSELNHIAKEANSEVDAVFSGKGGKLGQSAKAAVDAAHADTGKAVVGRKDVQAVTAEQIAEAIYARVINANGHIDLAENTSNLGMSPAASAVNRRELDWLKKDAFDKFMEQDLVKILTTYTQSMAKRAEYTHSFGAGGEKITDLADRAVLQELGGDTLITKGEKRLPLMVQAWKKAKAKAIAAGDEFTTPFPTLRHAGYQIHELSSPTASEDLRAAVKKLEPGFKAVMAIEGTLGNDISPSLRAVNSTLITYQNLRLMVPGLFSQYNDVMGVVVKGGTLGDAWDAFVRSMREIRLSWKGEKSTDKQAQRAEMWGTVEATAALDALGQTFGSMYLTGGAKRMNDALFKWNGMEAFNRAVRITATSVAERVITNYRTNGYDANNKAEVAMFERLFGKNFNPKAIQLGADGGLDTTNPVNQAAVMRWVSDAIMLPNASHRPAWASDPHFAPFWQFKQFAYTMHRVMLKNALEQAKLGNYRPGMVLLVGYAPVMIAADAVKELLIPGDEPPWMKMGLGSMIEHGVDRAGVFGIPQMFGEAVVRDYGIGLLGPSVGQISGMISDPLARSALGSLPAGSLLRRAATE